MRISIRHKAKFHLVACALAGVAFSSNALAAIVCASPNLDVPNTIDGIYLNMVTGQSGSSVPDWDINPYNNSAGLTFYGAGSPQGILASGTAGTSAETVVLTAGTMISPTPAPNFYNQYQTRGTAFQTAGTRLLGVRFQNEATSTVNYGWVEIVSGSTSGGFPATISRYCYENTGVAIAAGDTGAPPPVATLGFDVATLNFGNVQIGASSTAQTVTLSNTGTAPGDITALSINTAVFSISGGTCGATPFTLAAGADCTVTLTFSPTAAGAAAGTLSFTASTGAGTGTNATVALTGNGTAPPPRITTVPVDSPWALAALLGMFGLLAGVTLRRR